MSRDIDLADSRQARKFLISFEEVFIYIRKKKNKSCAYSFFVLKSLIFLQQKKKGNFF